MTRSCSGQDVVGISSCPLQLDFLVTCLILIQGGSIFTFFLFKDLVLCEALVRRHHSCICVNKESVFRDSSAVSFLGQGWFLFVALGFEIVSAAQREDGGTRSLAYVSVRLPLLPAQNKSGRRLCWVLCVHSPPHACGLSV